MRSQPVEFLELVEDDLRDVYAYYDSWLPDGGRLFQERFRDTIAWIEWNPELFPRRYRFFRRAIVRESYFGVFYAIEPDITTVVAVLDLRQNPKEIRRMVLKRKSSL